MNSAVRSNDNSPLKPVHCTLEPNIHNSDGSSCTVYFEGPSTVEDAKAAFSDPTNINSYGGLGPNLDMEDPWPIENGLTKTCGLTAWQCIGE